MAKSGSKLQTKVKPGQRAKKAARCPLCKRVTKHGRSCQFHKKYQE